MLNIIKKLIYFYAQLLKLDIYKIVDAYYSLILKNNPIEFILSIYKEVKINNDYF